MIDELNNKLNKMNEKIDVNIEVPNPNGESLKAASRLAYGVGALTTAVGIVTTSKFCIALGILGIASGAIQNAEANRKKDK